MLFCLASLPLSEINHDGEIEEDVPYRIEVGQVEWGSASRVQCCCTTNEIMGKFKILQDDYWPTREMSIYNWEIIVREIFKNSFIKQFVGTHVALKLVIPDTRCTCRNISIWYVVHIWFDISDSQTKSVLASDIIS